MEIGIGGWERSARAVDAHAIVRIHAPFPRNHKGQARNDTAVSAVQGSPIEDTTDASRSWGCASPRVVVTSH